MPFMDGKDRSFTFCQKVLWYTQASLTKIKSSDQSTQNFRLVNAVHIHSKASVALGRVDAKLNTKKKKKKKKLRSIYFFS